MNQINRPTNRQRSLAHVEGGLAWVPDALAAVPDSSAVPEIAIPATGVVAVDTDADGPHLAIYATATDSVPVARIRIGDGSVLDRMEATEALTCAGTSLRAHLEEHHGWAGQ